MKKILWVIFVLVIQLAVSAQTIHGFVFEQGTKAKIQDANIYFGGTSTGATSDFNGKFELDVSKYAPMPITISCIGYYSLIVTDYSPDKTLMVYLEPKNFEINEVVVEAKSLIRKKKANLQLFRSIFIGTTPNSWYCEIANESDITFNYSADKDTLKAFASKPLTIVNKALGYRILYYLDKFEYQRKDGVFSYRGSIFFNQDSIRNSESLSMYLANRAATYPGSRLHFFRVLWEDKLEASGFKIETSDGKPVGYNDLVRTEAVIDKGEVKVRKYLTCPSTLKVYYGSSKSTAHFLKPRVFFDQTGFCEDSSVLWEGEMVIKRIGDDLPFDYVFSEP